MPVSCRQPAQQKQDGWDEISCHRSYSVWASIARGSRLFWKYSLPAKNDKMLLIFFFFIIRFEFCNAGYSQPGAELEMTKHFHNRPLGLQPVVWGKCHCPMRRIPCVSSPKTPRRAWPSRRCPPFQIAWCGHRDTGKSTLMVGWWCADYMVCVQVVADRMVWRGTAFAVESLFLVLSCPVTSTLWGHQVRRLVFRPPQSRI